jgi:vitamin B12 transporter
MKHWLCALIQLSVFAWPVWAIAQETEDPDERPLVEIPETVVPGRPDPFPAAPLDADTVITPSRRETSRSSTGSSVTVITSEQIQAMGQSSVVDVLRGAVGVDVVQQGGPGKISSVFLRGANSEHTKVLLDGLSLNNPADPTRRFDFSTLLVDNIERIEIVRGPQSAIYGSDAIGGVINIITSRGSGPATVRSSVMGGSFGTHQESVNVSGGNCCYYYSLGAAYYDTDGFTAVSSRFGATELDGYQNATLSGRFGWTPSDLWNVDYVFRYIDAQTEIDGFDPLTFMPADELNRDNKYRQLFNRVQLSSSAMDGILSHKVGFGLTDFQTIDTAPGVLGTPQFDGQSRTIDWQGNLLLTEANTFTAGVDYLQEEASPFNNGQQTQNLASFYLQDRFDVADFSSTSIGVRWDDHSVAGTAQTYRLTQLFNVVETGAEIHGSIGRGFRAPAISQRFGAVGNPNLRPEFSKGWDIGWRQSLANDTVSLDATYFRNDFRDLIVFVAGPFGPFGFGQLRNVQRATASGIELTGTVDLTSCTTVALNYTYSDTEDLLNGRQLLRRPRNKGSFSIHRRLPCDRASLNLYFYYVGSRNDFDATGGIVDLPDYITVNLSGTYRLSERWEAFARIHNLTDSDYEEVFAFSTPGIAGYAGMEVTW